MNYKILFFFICIEIEAMQCVFYIPNVNKVINIKTCNIIVYPSEYGTEYVLIPPRKKFILHCDYRHNQEYWLKIFNDKSYVILSESEFLPNQDSAVFIKAIAEEFNNRKSGGPRRNSV